MDDLETETIRLRGRRAHLCSSESKGFVTLHCDGLSVFVDFEAEFGFLWEEHPGRNKMLPNAKKLAMQRMHDKLEERAEKHRAKWRR